MQKCRELSRLPPARKLKSLNFKHTTPGSIGVLFGAGVGFYVGPLDPTHPAAQLRQYALHKLLPQVKTGSFTLRAIPQAALNRVAIPWPSPPFSPAPEKWPNDSRLNVSIMKIVSKSVSKSACVRSKIGLRIKTALSLIVTRGADVERDVGGVERIVFKEEDVGATWLLSSWSYIVQPTLEVYRMPYEKLIPSLRVALSAVKHKADKLDASEWSQAQDPRMKRSPNSAVHRSSLAPSRGKDKRSENQEPDCGQHPSVRTTPLEIYAPASQTEEMEAQSHWISQLLSSAGQQTESVYDVDTLDVGAQDDVKLDLEAALPDEVTEPRPVWLSSASAQFPGAKPHSFRSLLASLRDESSPEQTELTGVGATQATDVPGRMRMPSVPSSPIYFPSQFNHNPRKQKGLSDSVNTTSRKDISSRLFQNKPVLFNKKLKTVSKNTNEGKCSKE
ncbi:uncharacterized protein FIBRA_07865 [Fibroporia radiculosa]|uniref:Uncharacterized protein n=1 Tax=Fibroporia radiculosa TaxID=599839 RepID=J4IC18_9APHY|nr:uncharacterized protein FIBRA_07865 [Fibroporia radiculosa]CCM05636.1 predicted protein [Fibroporia radiculosa]